MKQIIYIILALLMIANVSAIIAGTNDTVLTIPQCEHVLINVTGTEVIDVGEYSFIDCDEVDTNYWYCNCTDNYNLIMSINVNAINNYTLLTEAFYPGSTGGGSSGGSSHSSTIIYTPINQTEEPINETIIEVPIEEPIVIEQPVITPPVVEQNTTEVVEEMIEEPSGTGWIVYWILAILLIIGLIILGILKMRKHYLEE